MTKRKKGETAAPPLDSRIRENDNPLPGILRYAQNDKNLCGMACLMGLKKQETRFTLRYNNQGTSTKQYPIFKYQYKVKAPNTGIFTLTSPITPSPLRFAQGRL
jgi:hypothetical protein